MDDTCLEVEAIDGLDDWTLAIRRDPSDADARMARGMAFAEGGDFDRASADFAEALRLDPNPLIRHRRGVEYLRMGEPGMAVAEFTNALAIDPEFLDAVERRAEAFWTLGDRARAAFDERLARRMRARTRVRLRVVAEEPEPGPREAPLKRA